MTNPEQENWWVLRAQSGDREALDELLKAVQEPLYRQDQWLIYGPWSHYFNTTSRFADADYGPDAIIELFPLFARNLSTGEPI